MQQPSKPAISRQGVSPSDAEQAAVKALIQEKGERDASAALELDRTTLARVAAGLSVRKGTLALVRERLRALALNRGAA